MTPERRNEDQYRDDLRRLETKLDELGKTMQAVDKALEVHIAYAKAAERQVDDLSDRVDDLEDKIERMKDRGLLALVGVALSGGGVGAAAHKFLGKLWE